MSRSRPPKCRLGRGCGVCDVPLRVLRYQVLAAVTAREVDPAEPTVAELAEQAGLAAYEDSLLDEWLDEWLDWPVDPRPLRVDLIGAAGYRPLRERNADR